MAGWKDVDEDQPFGQQRKDIDPLVFSSDDTSPELRWDPEKTITRPPAAPAPRPISTGEVGAEWVPGGTPSRGISPAVRRLARAVAVMAWVMLPLGMLAAIAVGVLRAYGAL